jgi:hypothetical protein
MFAHLLNLITGNVLWPNVSQYRHPCISHSVIWFSKSPRIQLFRRFDRWLQGQESDDSPIGALQAASNGWSNPKLRWNNLAHLSARDENMGRNWKPKCPGTHSYEWEGFPKNWNTFGFCSCRNDWRVPAFRSVRLCGYEGDMQANVRTTALRWYVRKHDEASGGPVFDQSLGDISYLLFGTSVLSIFWRGWDPATTSRG